MAFLSEWVFAGRQISALYAMHLHFVGSKLEVVLRLFYVVGEVQWFFMTYDERMAIERVNDDWP